LRPAAALLIDIDSEFRVGTPAMLRIVSHGWM